jgi:hypothetical protein
MGERMTDILEKLHGFEIVFTDGGGRGWGWAPVTLVREAADEIGQLRKEIERLSHDAFSRGMAREDR